MNQDVLLSKIVATPTTSCWSQAYSTLNLYLVLSLEKPGEESIASVGKGLFERLQREFFALDEKNLSNIKEAVSNALEVSHDASYSIVLATIVKDTLYLIVAGQGSVLVRRDDKIGTVAKGNEGSIEAFSGPLKHDDIILLQTHDFSEKIPLDKISEMIDHLEVAEITENLAPSLHENAKGTEAAIVLQYKMISPPLTEEEKPIEIQETEGNNDKPTTTPAIKDKNKLPLNLFRVSVPKIRFFKGKGVIALAIILIVVLLAISLFAENNRREEQKREKILTEFLSPLEKKFGEAQELLELNKGLAVDEFLQIKEALSSAPRFPKKSSQEKKLSEFAKKVSEKTSQEEASSKLSNQKVFFDPEKEDIKEVSFVTIKGAEVVVVNSSGTVAIIDSSGNVKKNIKTKLSSVNHVTSDSSFVYALSNSEISKINKKTGVSETIIKDVSESFGIETFFSNVYSLNTNASTVDKHTAPSFAKKAYFEDGVTLDGPISFSIDSSIWVIQTNGQIRKFTKGKEETFSIKGLSRNFGKNSLIYTDQDYSSIYVLDAQLGRIVVIDKEGSVKTQYASADLSLVSSFAIDEKGEKGYFVLDKKLISFDL